MGVPNVNDSDSISTLKRNCFDKMNFRLECTVSEVILLFRHRSSFRCLPYLMVPWAFT